MFLVLLYFRIWIKFTIYTYVPMKVLSKNIFTFFIYRVVSDYPFPMCNRWINKIDMPPIPTVTLILAPKKFKKLFWTLSNCQGQLGPGSIYKTLICENIHSRPAIIRHYIVRQYLQFDTTLKDKSTFKYCVCSYILF